MKLGDEVPGPWGGEVDYAYEPQAWDILIRSDRAAPEERSSAPIKLSGAPQGPPQAALPSERNVSLLLRRNRPYLITFAGSSPFRGESC